MQHASSYWGKKMKLIKYVVMLFLVSNLLFAQTQDKIPWPSLADSPWPTWRKDAQATGRSNYVGPSTNNVIYRKDMPLGVIFGPVIGYDDILYMGTRAIQPDSNYFFAINPDGTELWNFRTELSYPNYGAAIISNDTTIYFPSNNGFVYALDKNGKEKWKIGPLAIGSRPTISISKNGDLYVSTFADSLVIIDTNLGEIKHKKYLGEDLDGIPVSFTTDGENIVYVTDSYLVYADLAGNEIWSRTFNSLTHDSPLIDNSDNIYVIGSDTTNHFVDKLFSIDKEGNIRWEFIIDGNTHSTPPTIDSQGNIIFQGGKYLNDDVRFAIYSIDYDGNENWSKVIDPDLDDRDLYVGHPLTCDPDGKIYFGSSFGKNFYCLNSNGELLWKIDLEGNEFDSTPVIGSDGTLYIGAHISSLNTFHTRNLIAIKDKPNSVEDEETPTEFKLYQNYPNPFNPTTRIKYQVSSIREISLKVYNVLGKEVTTLVNEVKPAGNYEIEFDGSDFTSGVYFYVLQVSGMRLSKKMLLIK